MPCMATPRNPAQTLAERIAESKAALARLEKGLVAGQVRVVVGPNGGVAFVGWADRDDLSDVCAYRSLSAMGSHALRQAVARAESASGRKVHAGAVAQGWHSHDGGNSWSRH